jgi:hypothetical protein
MADVTTVAQMYDNAGVAITASQTGANFEQIVNTQGIAGRTLVVTIEKDAGDMTEAELVTVLKGLTRSGGSGNGSDTNGPDAFTVVGIADFDGSDPAYVMLQGTGTIGNVPAGFTVTTVATFALAV